MSELINKINKRIYKNKPTTDMYGQYNVGKVLEEDNESILGITQNKIILYKIKIS